MMDNPLINSLIFYPRSAQPGTSRAAGAQDGSVPVEDGVEVGYRLYRHKPGAPVIVYFHGNGEVAADHDDIAALYRERVGASLLVFDFRGYGWSTGTPSVVKMLPDALTLFAKVPDILGDLTGSPLFVMGRSLGGPSAVHIVRHHAASLSGLILESTLSDIVTWLTRKGLPAEILPDSGLDTDFAKQLKTIDLPLLVIHGERDTLIPPAEGQRLFEASSSSKKQLVTISEAGHNTLLSVGMETYFTAIERFISDVLP